MKLRRIVFWLHLFAGVIAGLVVAIMSVTGLLLAFERQMTEWADRDLRVVPSGERLSISALLAVEKETPPSGLTIRFDPAAPAALNLGRERTLFVNPYSGAKLGEGSGTTRAFFRSVTNIHRTLGVPDENRAIGRAITGGCNLAFLFLVVSGFYLWWPRGLFVPRLKLRGKARDFNWHNAVGFWSAPFLFFIVLSGVLISYQWANNLLYRLTRSEPPPIRAGAGPRPPRENGGVIPPEIDRFWSIAQERVPDWKTISVRFGAPAAPLTFSIEQGQRGRPDLRSQLSLDPKSGEVVRWEPFESFNLGRRLRTWARFVHTGEAGGVIGQTIGALVCAGATLLVWTGFSLTWRRFRARS